MKQLAHICLYTQQPEAMLDFYRKKLDLPLQFSMQNDSGEEFGWYVALGNVTFIEIFDAPKAAKQWGGSVPDLSVTGRVRHFCIQVEDLGAEQQRLAKRGVEVARIKTGMDGSRQGWIEDPDGNAIELMQYVETSLQLRGH
jgi:catechol 2,3-dioxygenase-like lactoylglutathione lyase family enzyme